MIDKHALQKNSTGQLSGVSTRTRVRSSWVPSSAASACWHVAQLILKASPMLAFRSKKHFIPNSEPLVNRLILLSMLEGKSDAQAGARPGYRLLTGALPWPRLRHSTTQAALPMGILTLRPRPSKSPGYPDPPYHQLPGVSGLGPPARQGTTHGGTFRLHHRVAVVVEPWDGQDPPADST